MPILFRDYETRSAAPIEDVGADRYAEDPSTDVLCCSYAVDDGPIKLWVPGDPIPEEFIEAATNPDWLISAFNDQFERSIEQHIMAPRYGWPPIPIEQRRCTQASALSMTLPSSLEKVAGALRLELQKDMAGHKNMLAVSKPRRPRKDEDPDKIYWHDDPARLEQLYIYGARDVEVERAVHARLGYISAEEQAVWEHTAKVNARGVYIDQNLAHAAIKLATALKTEINTELAAITNNTVTSTDQTKKLIAWSAAHDCAVENSKKETLGKALKRENIPAAARRVVELRLEGAHAAVNKFKKMLACRNSDGRARGALQYHGASTGRWSSYGIQLQNMKREGEDMGAAIEAVASGDLALLKSRYPHPMNAIGDVARAALCAAPGHRFIVADFSGIESRVLAFLAGEQTKLDQWAKFDRTGDPEDEPYLIFGKSFNLPFINDVRFVGKTADLAFGYMGSVGAWRNLARDDPSTNTEIQAYKQAWRNAHPCTVKFWGAINQAAIHAVHEPGKVFRVNRHISFECDKEPSCGFLRMTLPSRRKLA